MLQWRSYRDRTEIGQRFATIKQEDTALLLQEEG